MIVSIDKFKSAVSRYIEQDLAPVITDKGFQFAVTFLSELIKLDTPIIENYLRQPIIASLIPYIEDAKGYDITKATSALKNALNRCTVLPIKIPAIPFLSPEEKEIKFSASDIERIEQYLK